MDTVKKLLVQKSILKHFLLKIFQHSIFCNELLGQQNPVENYLLRKIRKTNLSKRKVTELGYIQVYNTCTLLVLSVAI